MTDRRGDGHRPIRIGAIGLDHWYAAIPFVEQAAARPDYELVRVVDAQPGRAERVLRGVQQGSAGTDPAEVTGDDSIDVVACFTSVDRSAEIAVAAARAGKHIISVKPMALSLAEADRVVETVEASGVTFVPSESRHRSPLARELGAIVHGGRIGDLRSGTFAMNSSLPQSWPDAADAGWWIDPARTPGGGWVDHAVYQVDRMRWLFGSPVASVSGVVANVVHRDIEVEDYGHAIFTLESGAVVTIEDTWIAPESGFRNSVHLIGSRGEIVCDTVTGSFSVLDADGWTRTELPADTFDTLDTMAAALREGIRPISGVQEARQTLADCLRFYSAAQRLAS
jgi:predicted dehydrogenase